MKKFIIKTHSFVDVITNSSTELFVCDTDKSVDTIKDLFREKCQETNDMDWYDTELYVTELDNGFIEIESWLNDPEWFHDFVNTNFTVISSENLG